MARRHTARRDEWAERWWSFIAPCYNPAVGLVGWHGWQEDLVRDVASGRLLDVGCGPAHLAPGLMSRGIEYVGVDRNAAMVVRANRRISCAPGIGAVIRADVTALPFRAASFDVVVATGVLGLLNTATRRTALREIARVARADVRLLEPVHRPGAPTRAIRSRLIAFVRDHPIDLAELVEAGLDPTLRGPAVLARVYSRVDATRR